MTLPESAWLSVAYWSGKRDSNPRPSAWEASPDTVHCVYWGHYVGCGDVMHTIHKLTDNQNDNLAEANRIARSCT